MSFRKVSIKSTRLLKDEDSGKDVLHVDSPHALFQAAGYLKFKFGASGGEGIYFRGQQKLYDGGSLTPSLYRGISSKKTQDDKHAALSKIINEFIRQDSIFQKFNQYAYEPLLQHYGISTSWIDIVDNVWIALWFACYKAIKVKKFMHFEERIPSDMDDKDKFAYILLVAADLSCFSPHNPGYYSSSKTELIDLRIAAPSIFLRPHDQHGLLFRKKDKIRRPIDYADQIRGVIRVDLAKAIEWIGNGKMINTHSLFPPPYYDNGYQILLNCDAARRSETEYIAHIGV